MKNYIILFSATLLLIFNSQINSPAFAQADPATNEDAATSSANRPGSSTHPVIEEADPNKAIQQEKSGKVVPEKIAPPLDECNEDVAKKELKDKKHFKKKCVKKDHEIKPPENNGSAMPSKEGAGY